MDITLDRPGVEPGLPIEGTIRHTDAAQVILTLRWQTAGHGDRDERVVDSKVIAMTGKTTAFSIATPDAPFSFTGRLISVSYMLRAEAGEDRTEVEVVIGPGGRAVRLYPAASAVTRSTE